MITVDGYLYAGKRLPLVERLQDIIPRLPTLKAVMIVDYLGDAHACANALPHAHFHAHTMHHALKDLKPKSVHFEKLAFNHPLYILYSSGTTGVPISKSIVCSAISVMGIGSFISPRAAG
jgi:acetoacetyl-CoA synthetase